MLFLVIEAIENKEKRPKAELVHSNACDLIVSVIEEGEGEFPANVGVCGRRCGAGQNPYKKAGPEWAPARSPTHVPRTFWGRSGHVLGTFWERSENVLRTF